MPTLNFKGKSFVQNHHLAVPYHELNSVKKRGLSKTASLHDNLIVEGDNLLALKALLPTYHGKVKCIYIDPPYNTGNEGWAYNDNVNSPMLKAWLGKTVDRDDLTRHDKWCCMMLPRLKLLRELLTEDGAIFVSIDDNEVHRLRCLMDEVFGEENFVANIIWQKKYAAANDHEGIAPLHDHLLVYRQNDQFKRNLLPRTVSMDSQYRFEDDRGIFRISDYTCNKSAQERPNLYYGIENPDTGEQIWPKKTRVWAYSREEHQRHVEQDLIWWGVEGNAKIPQIKRYRHLLKTGDGYVPSTLWDFEFCSHTDDAKKEFRSIFPTSTDVNLTTIKPIDLIRRVIQVASDKDSIVLDSFAGSGTTAHAVLAQNREDGGSRRFVLVECEDYVNDITAERVRRVIKGVPKARDENLKKGLGGTFSYFKLGRPLEKHSLLEGDGLPDFEALAAYVFFTATGEDFQPRKIRKKTGFIGESRNYDVFLMYEPSIEKLRDLALDLKTARALPSVSGKRKLVFAPTRYLDDHWLGRYNIEFCQLPYQIYEAMED